MLNNMSVEKFRETAFHSKKKEMLRYKGPVIKYRQGGDGVETKFLHNIFLTTTLFLQIFSGPPHKS